MDNFSALEEKLKHARIDFKVNEPLSKHSSFRIGGPVRLMAVPQNSVQVSACMKYAMELGVEPIILGNGSNVLAPDGNFDAFVIKTTAVNEINIDGENLHAGAGALLSRVAAIAAGASLSGMEFAHGIPGTVGGAVFMNAGAYGGEMKDIVTSVRALDEEGVEHCLEGQMLDFGYRHSFFSDKSWLITCVTIKLGKDDPEKIKNQMALLAKKRSASQPLNIPSAGSTFKRPTQGYAAALIEQAGLKGLRIGGAEVSEKHAGFVVNVGGATCADVLNLMSEVARTVNEKFGVTLEPEVRVLGVKK